MVLLPLDNPEHPEGSDSPGPNDGPPPCPEEVEQSCDRINDADIRDPPTTKVYSDNIIMDWPLLDSVAEQVQKSTVNAMGRQERNPPRANSRMVRDVPPTPMPPLSWQGYCGSARPTYASWKENWHRNHRGKAAQFNDNNNNNYNNNNNNNEENINFLAGDDDNNTKLSAATTFRIEDKFSDCRCNHGMRDDKNENNNNHDEYRKNNNNNYNKNNNNNNNNAIFNGYDFSKNCYDNKSDYCLEFHDDTNGLEINNSESSDDSLFGYNSNRYHGIISIARFLKVHRATKRSKKGMTNDSKSNLFCSTLQDTSSQRHKTLHNSIDIHNTRTHEVERDSDIRKVVPESANKEAVDADTLPKRSFPPDKSDSDLYAEPTILDVESCKEFGTNETRHIESRQEKQKTTKKMKVMVKKSPLDRMLKLMARWSGWKRLMHRREGFKFVKLCKDQLPEDMKDENV